MSLSDSFNRHYFTEKTNDSVLRVHNGSGNYYYDFGQRLLMASNGESIPFAQVDRDVLIAARDRLVALNGDPPELPAEAPATQAASRKFNL